MLRMVSRILIATTVIAVAGAAAAKGHTTTFAVYGDSPYGTKQGDNAQELLTPGFIDAVNADADVSLVIHVGDIHSGKQFCTEAYDLSIFDFWRAFQDPLVYTPGDNEWSDCHKPAEGGNVFVNGVPVDYANGDPVANLDLVRSIFFSRPGFTLGQHDRHVQSQTHWWDWHHPEDRAYVENVMWVDGDVLYVTVNVPGGSNNDVDPWYGAAAMTAAQVQEKASRDGAGLRWLDHAFDFADDQKAKAVVIVLQADMWDPEKGVAHQQAYEPYVDSIANHTLAFGRPVLMFNGDSHEYKTGNPLAPSSTEYFMHPFYNVPNFHRLVVHGSTLPLEYLRVTIDLTANEPNGPDAFGPFSWTRVKP